MTKDEMIRTIRQLAHDSGTKTVPRPKFLKHARLSERQVARLFGSYNGLVVAAGLDPMTFPQADQPGYSDDELVREIVRVLRLPDSKMTRIFFEQNGSVSSSACERRFGGWINALRTALPFLDKERDKELVERLKEYTSPTISPISKGRFESEEKREAEHGDLSADHAGDEYVPPDSTNVYGDFINFRGLQHAPVNEQGVVFLFGMICRELDYVVESVRSSFPDCEAKRAIPGKPGKWQRVRIEFEYYSRSFRIHGHDPDQCDVIVCWEHNWPDCPIEVLELRSELARLSNPVQ